VSYFLLRAQCRQCGSYISPRYVVVEFLTAFLFAFAYAVLSGRGECAGVIAVYLGLIGMFILSSFVDIELRIIPDSVTVGGILLAPVCSVLVPQLHRDPISVIGEELYRVPMGRGYMFSRDNLVGALAACLVGMAVGALATWLVGVFGKLIFRREAMGVGDVKFMAAVGGFLGWKPLLLIFFTAPLLGSVVGLIHLARTREHHIPYGPFLSIAAVVIMFWGDKIFTALGLPG
jgi:leader peptidase (prepilin peptidase)/N-methyltransferase